MAGLHIHGDKVLSLSWLRAAWVLCGQEPGAAEAAGGAEKRGAARNGLHAMCCTWAGLLVAPQHRRAPAGRSELHAGLSCLQGRSAGTRETQKTQWFRSSPPSAREETVVLLRELLRLPWLPFPSSPTTNRGQ